MKLAVLKKIGIFAVMAFSLSCEGASWTFAEQATTLVKELSAPLLSIVNVIQPSSEKQLNFQTCSKCKKGGNKHGEPHGRRHLERPNRDK